MLHVLFYVYGRLVIFLTDFNDILLNKKRKKLHECKKKKFLMKRNPNWAKISYHNINNIVERNKVRCKLLKASFEILSFGGTIAARVRVFFSFFFFCPTINFPRRRNNREDTNEKTTAVSISFCDFFIFYPYGFLRYGPHFERPWIKETKMETCRAAVCVCVHTRAPLVCRIWGARGETDRFWRTGGCRRECI